jgi:hypothetical protein
MFNVFSGRTWKNLLILSRPSDTGSKLKTFRAESFNIVRESFVRHISLLFHLAFT